MLILAILLCATPFALFIIGAFPDDARPNPRDYHPDANWFGWEILASTPPELVEREGL